MALQSMTALASITLQGASSFVTFSNIPQNYRDLVIVWDGTASANTGLGIIFNSDAGANYTRGLMIGTGSSTVPAIQTDNGFGETGTIQSNNIFNVMDYSTANKRKTVLAKVAANGNFVAFNIGIWANTAAINSVTLDPASTNTFSSGSTFDLYGRIG
jgi:hypothetical protein